MAKSEAYKCTGNTETKLICLFVNLSVVCPPLAISTPLIIFHSTYPQFHSRLSKWHTIYMGIISDQKLCPQEATNKYKLPVNSSKAKRVCYPFATICYTNEFTIVQINPIFFKGVMNLLSFAQILMQTMLPKSTHKSSAILRFDANSSWRDRPHW